MTFRRLALLALPAMIASCAVPTTGVAYETAIQRTEATLDPQVDRGIFPYVRDVEGDTTTYHFIEGDRWNKSDHAFPRRVIVTITSRDEGRDSTLDVRAGQKNFLGSAKSPAHIESWTKALESAIETKP